MRLRNLAVAAAILFASARARAFDIPKIKLQKSPITVDVTEVSIGSWRFKPRLSEGGFPGDGGWGQWLNRLNAAIKWKKWTLGIRLDSVVYWDRPDDGCREGSFVCPRFKDYSSRWHDSIYPAKLWVTYEGKGIEATVGDAYVQMGRGLVLSMRKIDDLGIDNTIRGGKVTFTRDPFQVTVIGGLANPSHIDEASGRSLFIPRKGEVGGAKLISQAPQWGSDRIVAAEIQAGRGKAVVLSTQVMHLSRCAPYAKGSNLDSVFSGGADVGFLQDFGIQSSCAAEDIDDWLGKNVANGIRKSPEVTILGQSIDFPKLGKYGNLYIGAAMIHKSIPVTTNGRDTNFANPNGNALYLSYSGTIGKVTNTFEIKSYRNYEPAFGSTNQSSQEFSNIAYNTPPTTEVITQDAMFGAFNYCVDGGRLRTDVRLTKGVLVWGQGIYAHTKSEQNAECNAYGKILGSTAKDDTLQDDVVDVTAGLQWDFDKSRSYVYAQAGGRGDWRRDGRPIYRETQTRYTISKYLGGPFSLEFAGFHRIRWEDGQNVRNGYEQQWLEGENYTAIKIAPRWVISQGFEYLSRLGYPTYYVNGSILYKFTKDSNIKILAGQQRGGLRCVNGVCRIFPSFEGVRAELTLRF